MNEEQYNELSDLADKFFSQFDNDIRTGHFQDDIVLTFNVVENE